MLRKLMLSVGFVCFLCVALAQDIKVYPTNWYVGMKQTSLQIMVHAAAIGTSTVKLKNYAGVQLQKVNKVESKNYLFLDLVVAAAAKPGTLIFEFSNGGKQQQLSYELKARKAGNGKSFAQGVNASDLVYLLMPDRFSNGDTGNDKFSYLKDTVCDRTNPSLRHGGDLKGVSERLDYLKELGVTSLWMCPITENNMPLEKEPNGYISGYHGYWFTDLYTMDARYGGNEAYAALSNTAHSKGMKMVQDMVYNHFGIEHFLMKDPPQKDFFNQWNSYTGSNHRDEAIFGTYANAADKKVMLDGWFTPHLPDVNQRNPYMAKYLIQNVIWCTENFGVDAWRVDTYKYCDEAFLNTVNSALLNEFPAITIFGEAWTNTVMGSAYFARNNMTLPFKHNLQGVTDFPIQSAMLSAIQQPFGWTEGVNRLYMTLAQDGLYQDPMRNCIFLDNHDMDRFFTMVGEDLEKYKMGIGLLLTLRGIPQLYYGTEILMKNSKAGNDGYVREDFPGGFPGDRLNKFNAADRNERENAAFTFVKTLANYRKQSAALTQGKLEQYLPQDGVYVYFRSKANQTVMCILNSSKDTKQLATGRFATSLQPFTKGKNVITGNSVLLKENMTLAPSSITILELQ